MGLETLRELVKRDQQRREQLVEALHIEMARLPAVETTRRKAFEAAIQAASELMENSRVEMLRLGVLSKLR